MRRWGIVLALLWASAWPIWAQEAPKVGVVLGGGGARGLAHIGVLQVLEANDIPVDVLTGTSMGSVVGSLYALGYSASELEALVLAQDWAALFPFSADALRYSTPSPEARSLLFALPIRGTKLALPEGLMANQPILTLLSRLHASAQLVEDFTTLPIPFGCVAANLQTGDKRLFTGGNLRTAVLASMSIPGLLPPVEIDGASYIDGGIVQNLPVSEARTLGADVTIAVFTGVPPADEAIARNAAAVLGATLDIWRRKNAEAEFPNADVLIAPAPVEAMTAFDQVEETIEAGRVAAQAALPEIRQVLREAGIPLRPRNPANRFLTSGLIPVAEVRVEGVTRGRARRLLKRIGLRAGQPMPQARLERRLANEYERGGWATLAYRLERAASGSVDVVVEAQRRQNNWVGIGLRYDTEENIAAQVRLRHAALAGAVHAEAHLGAFLQSRFQYAVPFPVPVLGDFRIGIEAQRRPLPLDLSDRQVRRDHTQVRAAVALEWLRSRHAAFETNSQVRYGLLPALDQEIRSLALGARFRFEKSNAMHQPHRMTRGARLHLAYERSLLADIEGFGERYEERLARFAGHMALAQPLTRWLSVFVELDMTTYTLLGIPLWDKVADTEAVDLGSGYFLGGFEPAPAFDTHRVRVPGLAPYAWSASSAEVLRTGAHIGRAEDAVMFTLGYTNASASGPSRDFFSYYGLLAIRTPFGPVSGGFSLGSGAAWSYYVSTGYTF
ncbi:MAG: patatin-like phospholipase family protein [Bacteroidota bacterium]